MYVHKHEGEHIYIYIYIYTCSPLDLRLIDELLSKHRVDGFPSERIELSQMHAQVHWSNKVLFEDSTTDHESYDVVQILQLQMLPYQNDGS
jgi:hypothetical protein